MPSRLLFCLGLTSLLVNNAWAENASSVEETVLFRAGEEGYPAYRIPSLLTTKRGVVLAFCEARQGGDHGHNDLALKRSTDGARTWSPLRVIVRHPQDAFNNPTSICLRESGRVLLFYEHYPDGTGEQKVVPGYDGNVVSTYVISSDDDGVTWSQPRNISRQVKQETCQASLIRYSDPIDGEPSRLLFSNPAHQTKRVRMTVRLSRDEGKSWPAALLLHKGPSAYSCLTRLPNGDVGILFEAGETGPYETIRLARFPIAWLEAAVPSTTASGQPQPNPSIQGPDNKDRLTNSAMHTLSLEAVVADHKTGRDGNYIPTRVTSTVSPVVVRQNDPNGPKYQEGIGYSFLLNSPKYPGLCKMDDGTLVLTLTASLSGETVSRNGVTFVDENTRTDVMLFSRDNGMSWSQPQRIPGYRTTPMNLGGKRLMLRGWNSKIDVPESYRFWFSEDGGETWSDEEPVAALPDGRRPITDVAPNMLIEGDTIRFMFYIRGAGTIMRPYNHVEHTWGDPYFFPQKWMEFARCSEASLTRAENGDLIASFRSSRPGIPSPSDKWRSILTARSTDDGETWTMPDVHSLYGHVHHSLLTMPDGRILMTYAARLGELDGRLYHGHEAVISRDHGKTWDWERRYILFRGTDGTMHSPQSVLLDDGRVFTILMHPVSYTWRDKQTKGNLIALSNVSAVIWRPE